MSTQKSIVVFSTSGKATTVETSAATWGELQNDLSKAGVSYSGMKAVDNAKRTYENKDAQLPDDLTNMFLFPVKTKSGAVTTYGKEEAANLSFSELRAAIKEHMEHDEEGAKAHYNEGKNYTTKSTADLKVLVGTYVPKAGGSTSAPKAAPAETKAVGKSTSSPKEKMNTVSRTVKSEGKPASNGVEKVVQAVTTSKTGGIDGIVDSLKDLKDSGNYNNTVIDDAIKAVLKIQVVAKGEIDTNALAAQAREIAKGFNDIKY